MSQINLLPEEVVVSQESKKVVSALRKISMFVGGGTLIFGVILGGLFFVRNKEMENMSSQRDKLKSDVLALEASENSLVLVRDRLTKLNLIDGKFSGNENTENIKGLVDSLPSNVSIKEMSASSEKSGFSVLATDSVAFQSTLALLLANTRVKKVDVESFSYVPLLGYQLFFNLF